MGVNNPFYPTGKTFRAVAGNSSANNVTITPDGIASQYRIVNRNATATVYVWISSNVTGNGFTNVAVPTGNGYAIVCPPNSQQVLTGPGCSPSNSAQMSVILDSTTANGCDIFVTPGEGMY